MSDEKKLKEFWTNNISKNWCHFHDDMPEGKTQKTIRLFREHLIEQLKSEFSLNALDWGCGGGVLAKEISQNNKVILLDISKRSLLEAERYSGIKTNSILLSEPIDSFKIFLNNIDLIYCYSVIQHFPSYNYWKKVSKLWIEISPKYIAGRTKFSDRVIETGDYYKSSKNFLNALILSKEDLLKTFPQYNLKYWYEENNKKHPYNDGFFILEKRK